MRDDQFYSKNPVTVLVTITDVDGVEITPTAGKLLFKEHGSNELKLNVDHDSIDSNVVTFKITNTDLAEQTRGTIEVIVEHSGEWHTVNQSPAYIKESLINFLPAQ